MRRKECGNEEERNDGMTSERMRSEEGMYGKWKRINEKEMRKEDVREWGGKEWRNEEEKKQENKMGENGKWEGEEGG